VITALISRTAQYGPVCCVVWEGRSVMGVPIPMCAGPWPGCYMVMSDILTQISVKVQTQADGAEG